MNPIALFRRRRLRAGGAGSGYRSCSRMSAR